MRYPALLFCLTAICCGSPSTRRPEPAPTGNKWSDTQLATVLEAQDHRDTRALLVLLKDTSSTVREAAAMALVSVQDTSARADLATAMLDARPGVRLAAAWALSYVADTNAAKAIATQTLREKDPAMADAFHAASFRALTKAKALPGPGELFAAFAKSEGYQRLHIAEVLRRLPKETLLPVEGRYVELLQREMQPGAKMLLLAGMGNFSDALAHKTVRELLGDPDPMIRIAALRAHRAINGNASSPELLQALNDSMAAVRSTAVGLLKSLDTLDGEACWTAGQGNADVMVQIPLYGLAVQFGDEGTRNVAGSLMRSIWDQPADGYVRAALIEARAATVGPDSLMAWMLGERPVVERQAAFAAAIRPGPGAGRTRWAEVLRAALGTGDAGLIASAAEELLKAGPREIGEVLAPCTQQLAMAALHPVRDLETRQLLDRAAAKRDGLNAPAQHGPTYNHPIDHARLATLAEGLEYRITTTKGAIVIAIGPDAAPGTCTAFDSLVASGFYHGKYFHRVVPGFVAQGGCPRGDGYGAMDWTLRTENGYAGFVTGAVGMASAGRDTESCQFFITLAPAPHLDGRYTRFAQVVDGMEVVQRLVVGDRITGVARLP